MRLLLLLCVPFLPPPGQAGPLPAFPGAEGFGAATPGGRGGRILKVTRLDARGPGSLQEAASARGPRLVVFEVGGVIRGDVVITEPFITIAGQTAPSPGITIAGMLSTAYRPDNPVHDVVVRFVRVRPPPGRGAGGDAIQFSCVERAILDHVSCAWAEDETIDIFTRAVDLTIQWCTVEESATAGHPKGRHNYGLIAGSGSRRISIHHNLFSHHSRRIPAVGGGPVDFRNNVAYDFRDGFSHEGNYSGTPGFNIVGNYYKGGPSDPKIFPFCFMKDVPYYLRDNFIEGTGIVQDPWAESGRHPGLQYYAGRGVKQARETPVPGVETHPPRKAYELVLSRAGCFPRDAVTRRNVEDTRQGTGRWGKVETPDLLEGLKAEPSLPDADGDGMPDAWERERGLDPSDPSDGRKVMKSGYPAVEEYLNDRAARLVEAGLR